MAEYDWIAPLISGVAKGAVDIGTGLSANNQVQAAYDEMLRNLAARMGDYDALGSAGYSDLQAQQVGPSALEGIQVDAAGRQAQLEAMAGLADLADRGGLNLADEAALNRIEGGLNRNVLARRKGLANEMQARRQLGSGAQLAMDLAAQQDSAQQANMRAEGIAGQAQQRALDAILQKAGLGRAMTNDDYQRQRDAALARDAIEARNAAARTDAAKYNNSLRGQSFEDNLAKARGKTDLTNSINQTRFGQGAQSARTTGAMGGYTNSLIDAGSSAFDSMTKNSKEGDSDTDIADFTSGAAKGGADAFGDDDDD